MNDFEGVEKIRNLFNKLQNVIITFKELEFTNMHLCYEFYKNHVELLSIFCDDSSYKQLSIKLFRSLFEENDDFSEYTVEKEESINILIEIIKGTLSEESAFKEIKIKAFYDKENVENTLEKIKDSMEKLEMDFKLTCSLLLYIMNNNYTLNSLLEMLIIIIKVKFPDSKICLENILNSNISFEEFIEKFNTLCIEGQICNYMDLKWNKEEKKFIVSKVPLDELTQIILNSGSKSKKTKELNSKALENKCNIEEKKEETKKKKKRQKKGKKKEEKKDEKKDEKKYVKKDEKKDKKKEEKIKEKKEEKKEEKKRLNIQNSNIPQKYTHIIVKEFDFVINEKKNIKNEQASLQEQLSQMKRLFESKFEEYDKKYTKSKKLNEDFIKELAQSKKQNEDFIKELAQSKKLKEDFLKELSQTKKENEKFQKMFENKLKKVSEKSEKKIISLSEVMLEKSQKIEELDFNLKMIGLRTAYKQFIDLFIYVFNLKNEGNLENKVNSITQFFTKKNKKNYNLKQLINILKKYIKYIVKIKHEKDYKEVLDVINAFSVDEPFKELVELRTKKFHMRKDIFQNTEKAIIKKKR